jgi:hypothetical protein
MSCCGVLCCVVLCPQTALQTADKQTIVGSLKDMLYKRRMERELLRAKGEASFLFVLGGGKGVEGRALPGGVH